MERERPKEIALCEQSLAGLLQSRKPYQAGETLSPSNAFILVSSSKLGFLKAQTCCPLNSQYSA